MNALIAKFDRSRNIFPTDPVIYLFQIHFNVYFSNRFVENYLLANDKPKRRKRLVRQYPAHSLEDVLPLASVIYDENAGLPLDRTLLAKGLGTTTGSSSFITKLASSESYGLTRGRYRDPTITLTALGSSIVANRNFEEFSEAATTAALRPPLFQKLFTLLRGMEIPEEHFLTNLLMRDVGIRRDQTSEFARIYQSNDTYLKTIGQGLNEASQGKLETSIIEQNPNESDGSTQIIPPQSVNKQSRCLVLIDASTNRTTGFDISALINKFDMECIYVPSEKLKTKGTLTLHITETVASIVVLAGKQENRDLENAYALGLAEGLSPDRVISVSNGNLDQEILSRLKVDGLEIIETQVQSVGLSVLEEFHRMGVIGINFT